MFFSKQLFLFVFTTLLFIVLFTPHTSVASFRQAYQATGNLHLGPTGAAGLGMPAMGTLTLANLPQGTIKKAFFFATQTNNTLGLSTMFKGLPLPVAGPYASEALLITLGTYRWDITANILSGALLLESRFRIA